MAWLRKKRVSKRKAGKRSFRRRGAGYRTVNLAKRSLNPIPQRMIAKHKYAETVTVVLGGGSINSYGLRLNSTFDPNFTGGGHQPYGRDTYATLYNRYRVIGCKYNISFVSSVAGLAIQGCAIPANDSLAGGLTTMAYCREMPRAKYVLQSPPANGAQLKNLKGYVDIASLMGKSKAQYMADDRTQALSSADPAEAAILNIAMGTLTEDGASATIYASIMLEYICEWFDPNVLGQS